MFVRLFVDVRSPVRRCSFACSQMFVRLFIDENLDRMVPISKQPKDKIQAILEASNRQFPEFRDRSRKRIRTYLKSCRRMRRSKDVNGWEPVGGAWGGGGGGGGMGGGGEGGTYRGAGGACVIRNCSGSKYINHKLYINWLHTIILVYWHFQLRPTPPHLTSAAAEEMLALACDNESNNAKRMRLGLQPLPVSQRDRLPY